jgi:NAD(P)-dependent dehydrogenase (short-subunit alcohol dehydrogenase family)
MARLKVCASSPFPVRLPGMPEEIAKGVLFLAADADYVTGQQINVNGGVYM